jgi:hypothetical protein
MAKDERKLPIHAIPTTAYKIITDLPPSLYDGIGKIVSAHAVLEDRVSQLLFGLMEIDESIGRTSLAYRAAIERFKTAKTLIDFHGLAIVTPLNRLEDQIKDCCDLRDQFAHGVWIEGKNGELAVRLTRGTYETPEGKADRRFVPEGKIISDDTYWDRSRTVILSTVRGVNDLIDEVKDLLQSRRAQSAKQ